MGPVGHYPLTGRGTVLWRPLEIARTDTQRVSELSPSLVATLPLPKDQPFGTPFVPSTLLAMRVRNYEYRSKGILGQVLGLYVLAYSTL